ncbi:MAG: LamG domain-containing protein [Lewinella sp.]
MKNFLSLLALFAVLLISACDDTEEPVQPMPDPELASLSDGLVFHAPFAGNASDVAGGLSGAVTGATLTTDRHGVANEAYAFDGIDDLIDYGTGDILVMANQTPYTMTAWVKMEDRGDGENNMIMSKFDDGVNAGWYFAINRDGRVRSYRHNVPWSLAGDTAIPYGEYVHIAAAYDGTTLMVYLNGVLDGSVAFGRNNNDRTTGVLLGGMYRQGEKTPLLKGVVDDVRIYDRVLTQVERGWLATH